MNDTDKLKELVAKFPVPATKDGKLAEVDKAATDAALAELVKGGKGAVAGLIDLLMPADKGGDGQVRHALHALVIHVGGLKDAEPRQTVAGVLASALGSKHPTDVKSFLLRQLQLVGGKEVVPAVGKLLTDDALGDDAAQTLLAIRDGAAEQFRAALPAAKGRRAVVIAHALGTLKDAESAGEMRKLLGGDDADARTVAGWALANLGDAGSASLLVKRADLATGFERTKLTQACLLLAENLADAGKKADAAAVYSHLSKTRTAAAEKHVKDAADRGLAAVK